MNQKIKITNCRQRILLDLDPTIFKCQRCNEYYGVGFRSKRSPALCIDCDPVERSMQEIRKEIDRKFIETVLEITKTN